MRLKVYPYFYNSATTDVQFYQDFTFNIATYVVPVSIVSLATDETTYPLNGFGTSKCCWWCVARPHGCCIVRLCSKRMIAPH